MYYNIKFEFELDYPSIQFRRESIFPYYLLSIYYYLYRGREEGVYYISILDI